jgi:hypothetical protein
VIVAVFRTTGFSRVSTLTERSCAWCVAPPLANPRISGYTARTRRVPESSLAHRPGDLQGLFFGERRLQPQRPAALRRFLASFATILSSQGRNGAPGRKRPITRYAFTKASWETSSASEAFPRMRPRKPPPNSVAPILRTPQRLLASRARRACCPPMAGPPWSVSTLHMHRGRRGGSRRWTVMKAATIPAHGLGLGLSGPGARFLCEVLTGHFHLLAIVRNEVDPARAPCSSR